MRRIWRKIHIWIEEETLEMRAFGVTTSTIGDAPMLLELLNQVPPDQNIGLVTADGAYDTRKCHDAFAACGAHAVIPFCKNVKPWKPTSARAIARNEAVNASRALRLPFSAASCGVCAVSAPLGFRLHAGLSARSADVFAVVSAQNELSGDSRKSSL